MLVRVGMHEVAVAVFMRVIVAGRIEGAMAMAVSPVRDLGVDRRQPESRDPTGKGNRRQQCSEKIGAGRKAESSHRKSRDWIAKAPARVAKREMRRVNVRTFVGRAVGGQEFVAANAEDALPGTGQHPREEQRLETREISGSQQRQKYRRRGGVNKHPPDSRPGLSVDCRAEHGAEAVGRHCPSIRGIGKRKLAFDEINRGNENESARHAGLEGKIKRLAQLPTLKHRQNTVSDRNFGFRACCFCRQPGQTEDQGGTDEKSEGIHDEIPAKTKDGNRERGQRRAENIRGIVGDGPERQGPRILRGSCDAGDDGFVNRREDCRSEIEQHGQHVDLPDLLNEEESHDNECPRKVARDHGRARPDPVANPTRPRGAEDNHDDPDRERDTEHRRRRGSDELMRQQAKGHRTESTTDQTDAVGREKAHKPVVSPERVAEHYFRHIVRRGMEQASYT